MSLDVYIKYKEPKKRIIKGGLDGVACGSTLAFYDTPGEVIEDAWHANVTHNMGKMAQHILVDYKKDGDTYSNDLYSLVWRPDEWNCCNTNIIAQALQSGIAYMVAHRDELMTYNPTNGWGNYHDFLYWLLEYWKACLDNPDCEIFVSR